MVPDTVQDVITAKRVTAGKRNRSISSNEGSPVQGKRAKPGLTDSDLSISGGESIIDENSDMEGIVEPETEKQNANSKEHLKSDPTTHKQLESTTQKSKANSKDLPKELPKTQSQKVSNEQAKHYWTFNVQTEQTKENDKNRKKLDYGKKC